MWMYYSAGSQSSWESVYYFQHHIQAGWLLRAMHFYTAQATLMLVGIYLVQTIFRGTYRAPREFLFWTVLLMGLATVGLNLTGDLLTWDQNGYWAGHVRTGFLFLTPGVGEWLYKLAVGGAEFGSLTLTRFLALHIGACCVGLGVLIGLHARFAWRHGLESSNGNRPDAAYWPRQAARDAVACTVVLAAILVLSARNGTSGPHAGLELGPPANAAEDPGTARPEWSFRGLYQFRELFPSSLEIVPIVAVPGLTVLIFFLMPLLAKSRMGHRFNRAFTAFVFVGLGMLAWKSFSADAKNERFQADRAAGRVQADRIVELATAQGIPPSGALTLLREDAKTQGPKLFNQHCAACHDFSDPSGAVHRPESPSASDLHGFAGRAWLTEFLTAKGISSPKFFGHTKFKQGEMYGFLKDSFAELEAKEREQIILALSHEAKLKSQRDIDAQSSADIEAGTKLIGENCNSCHKFHGEGTASGPDLTGYGSRAWLHGIIGDPAHKQFYGKHNDRMPAYAASVANPANNILSPKELEMLVDWLRGEWFEPVEK